MEISSSRVIALNIVNSGNFLGVDFSQKSTPGSFQFFILKNTIWKNGLS
jgi:hypothetical protein